ncbi:MAG: GNAT family N-acetyltransferase [Candidatus Fimadaptatus sp.]
MSAIAIKEYTSYRAQEVLRLYEAVGWSAYTREPDRLELAYASSLRVLAAYDGEMLVGLLRAVGDGCTVVYVQDLLVHPGWQRRGIGGALLERIMAEYPDVRQLLLLADDTPGLRAFYRAHGLRAVGEAGCLAFMRA